MPKAVLAADLGGTKLCVATVAPDGGIQERRTEPVDATGKHAPVKQIARLARLLGGYDLARHFAAVGVCVPGLVRPSGLVWAPNLPGWERVPLARMLHRELNLPVTVESDRNAAVLGEAWRGAARGCDDVVVLIVGTGIGAGILSGGRLVRGAHELSGCAGWMVVTGEESVEAQRCGELEAAVAGPGIAAAAVEAIAAGRASSLRDCPAVPAAEQVAEAARNGDSLAREVFARAGRRLGFAVANLVSLIDPEVIVLTGGLAKAADLYLESVRQVVRERAQPLSAARVRIRVSRMGSTANLLGVARLALESTMRPKAAAADR